MISNAAFVQLMQQINLPSAAAEYDRFALYCAQLQEWNQRMNLTAITQPDQVAKLHLLDSLTVLTAADLRGKRIIDVGCGAGFPGVPVVKITGNPRTYGKMKENVDINAGSVLTGEKTLQQVGEEIYRELLAMASGKLCKAEILGHDEQFCITRMP